MYTCIYINKKCIYLFIERERERREREREKRQGGKESNRGLTSEQIASATREYLAPFEDIFHQANVRVKSVIIHGAPGPAIVSHANEHPYDLVIIGSRGLNPVQEFVLGSVSHKVAKRVKAPVLVIK